LVIYFKKCLLACDLILKELKIIAKFVKKIIKKIDKYVIKLTI